MTARNLHLSVEKEGTFLWFGRAGCQDHTNVFVLPGLHRTSLQWRLRKETFSDLTAPDANKELM